jgi:hypothetical protein
VQHSSGSMDEEQHYEAFNVDNDYEGVVEIGGEFMFRCAAVCNSSCCGPRSM